MPLPDNSNILIRAHVETVLGNVNNILKTRNIRVKNMLFDIAVILVTKEVTLGCKLYTQCHSNSRVYYFTLIQ